MPDLIQFRRDTAANWTSVNPTLAQGELGLEYNTGKFKFGDGTTTWNSLVYAITVGSTEIWSGVGTIDFGSTPTDEATLVITGLGNMTTSANIHVFILGDDSTADNTADDHDTLSYFSRCSATSRVAATGFTAVVRLWGGLAYGTYKVHYQYTL